MEGRTPGYFFREELKKDNLGGQRNKLRGRMGRRAWGLKED